VKPLHLECERKVPYQSRVDAQVARDRLADRSDWTESEIRAYRCGRCGGWHVGRLPLRR